MFHYIMSENVNEIGLEHRKVVIFGAGDYGYYVGDFLEKYGISDYFYCVDDAYYREKMFFHSRPVHRFSNISPDDFNLIFAIAEIKRLKDFMYQTSGKKVFYIFDPYEFWPCDKSYISEYKDELLYAESLYVDEMSKQTMKGYLLAKQSGDISADLQNVDDAPMYFNELTNNVPGGSYIDCGSFDGENIDDYLKFVGNPNARVIAFEPVKENFEKLKLKYQNQNNIVCYNNGLWDRKTTLYIQHQGFRNRETILTDSPTEDCADKIAVETLDDCLKDDTVAFIKIMTGGNEFRVLKGAANTIRTNRPIIAVAPFCNRENLFRIPIYLNDFGFYKLYLRHYECVSGRLVLYAIPSKKNS